MRTPKQMCIAAALLVCSLCAGAAAGSGDVDTIRVVQGNLVVGQSRPVAIELWNDEIISSAAFTPELHNFGTGQAIIDSVRFVGRLADPTVLNGRFVFTGGADGIAPDLVTIIATAFGQNRLPPGSGPLVELWFTGTEAGTIEFIPGWTPAGMTTELYYYDPADPYAIPFAVYEWVSQPIQIFEAGAFPQVESAITTVTLVVGSTLELDLPIAYSGPEELTATAVIFGADDISSTPANPPVVIEGNPLEITWSPTSTDVGIWTLKVEVCANGDPCADEAITIQVASSPEYVLEMSPHLASSQPRVNSIVKGQFDSDPAHEILLAGLGTTYEIAFASYDAQTLTNEFSGYVDGTSSGTVAAFLDPDAHLDLVTLLLHGAHTVHGLLGDGSNGFTEVRGSQYLGYARGAVAAEINGDQHIDYLAAIPGGIALLSGDGDGTFTQLPGISIDAKTLTAADFNQDAKSDLAIGTAAGVEIHLGDGYGQFSYLTEYSQTYGAVDIEVTNQGSDFNSDDVFDLCISTPSIGGEFSEVVVYFGNGDGTFQPQAIRTISGIVLGNAVGDLNLDGHLDICYVNGGNRYIGILYGDGTGTFVNEIRYPVSDGVPTHLLLVDRELDGDLDIAVALASFAHESSSYLMILENQLDPVGMIAGSFEIELEGEGTLSIESPSGMVLNTIKNTFPSAALYHRTLDGDQTIDEYARIDVIEPGPYTISVSPRTAASSGTTFNLRFRVNDQVFTLADAEYLASTGFDFIAFADGAASISPIPGTVLLIGTVPISWPQMGAVNLQIARDPAFIDIVVDGDVSGNSYGFDATLAGSDDTTSYFWRVTPLGVTALDGESGKIGAFHVTDVSTDVDDDADEVLPGQFSLSQNYPNPFNPATTIEFTLTQPAWVTLDVTNVLGRKVKTLVAEELNAGTHRVDWLGRNDAGNEVASGLYFYRLNAGSNKAIRKMILLR